METKAPVEKTVPCPHCSGGLTRKHIRQLLGIIQRGDKRPKASRFATMTEEESSREHRRIALRRRSRPKP